MMIRFALLGLHTGGILGDETVVMMQAAGKKKVETKSGAREEHVNRLTQKATDLLRSGVTPDVETFANEVIDKINAQSIPSILDEHKIADDLQKQQFTEFGTIQSQHQGASVAISQAAEQEDTAKLSHTTCRDLQQQACDLSTQCNTTRSEKWQVIEDKEDLMNISYRSIQELWCVPGVEGEDESVIFEKSFYEQNVKIYETYKSRKEAAALAWDDYKSQLPICDDLTQKYLTQLAFCISNQTALEKASCKRANDVNMYNEKIKNAWTSASQAYTTLVNKTVEMATERQLEWQGVSTVKCLLDRIHDNTASETPCNENTDPEKIQGQIDSCHKAEDVNHLVIAPEPIPDTPVPFVLEPYPCTSGYAKYIGYTDLQSCTPAEPCNGPVAGCSATLPPSDNQPQPVAQPAMDIPSIPSYGQASMDIPSPSYGTYR